MERALKLADGLLVLVDASEGPLPQTRYVLRKALEAKLPPIVVVKNIDRADARPQEAINEIYEQPSESLAPLFDGIPQQIPAPAGDPADVLQLLVANLDYSVYNWRLAVGRIFLNTLNRGDNVAIVKLNGTSQKTRITKLHGFEGLERTEIDRADAARL